jgi:arginine/lysine/ornithine decarboxylase
MEAPDYVLAMTSICDTDEGFDRMAQALLSIDRELEEGSFDRNRELGDAGAKESNGPGIIPVQAMLPSKAWEQKTELLSFPESAGRISAVFLSQFPPGAPILIPGEIISQELITSIQGMLEEGITITGLSGDHRDYIEVLLL